LSQTGIETIVKAIGSGEADACGNFRLYATDFEITLLQSNTGNAAEQRELASLIYPIVTKLAKPNLGNVRLLLPDGRKVSLNRFFEERPVLPTVEEGWQHIETSVAPSARYVYGMAYDSHRNVTLLFGGDDTGLARLNDTWEFDGTNWIRVTPANSPSGRANIDQTLVYDSDRRRVILFGGLGSQDYLNDTWEYNGTTWLPITPATSPPKRDSHAMVFDNQRDVTVLFGGYNEHGDTLGDTWEYNGEWEAISPAQSPGSRFHHALAYDEERGVTMLFGGLNENGDILSDTWEFDGTTWNQVHPVQAPPARHNHGMAYDSSRGVIVLFGGEGESGLLNDTWEYDGTSWQSIETNQMPSPRIEMSAVFNTEQKQVILFGGGRWDGGELTAYDDTWTYNGPPLQPLPIFNRNVYVIVFDPLLNNGQNLSDYLGWYDHASLTQGTIDFFDQASNGRVQYTVSETTVVTTGWPKLVDGFQYTEEQYLAALNGQATPHSPSEVDYNLIVNNSSFDICGKANRREIDEVWIYNGPLFGFYESTLVGPDAYWFNSPPVPGIHSCNRLIPIMGPSPERGLEEAVHNFGHRTESTMTQVYGSWLQNRTTHSWEKFALVDALSPDYLYSGCGNIHYPPNGQEDYDYANSGASQTNCEDFANYPNLTNPLDVLLDVDCSTWACQALEYYRYWFRHFPAKTEC
jgi:hypothetical protein